MGSTGWLFFHRTLSYHRPFMSPPLSVSPLRNPPSVHRWYRNPPNVAFDALWKKENVPYTNRVHRVVPLRYDECQLVIEDVKKKHGDKSGGQTANLTGDDLK
jgi:hypothetical protein